MFLTCVFWAGFLLPGLALVFGCFPGLSRVAAIRRAFRVPRPTTLLGRIGYAYAGSLLLASPFSLLCYATNAPLWCFSSALCALAGLGALGLATRARRGHAPRLRRVDLQAALPYLILIGLLWLQGRVGGWLDGTHGDVTVYVARMRVLIEHGFTNRDVYLSQYRFQHVYHDNLLLALYASAAQLTGQSELTTWFHTETWAKLCVAAGHAVLGERLTGRREAGVLLALSTLTLTAAETYALYPNAWSVGYILPMLLALGFAPPALHAQTLRFLPRPSAWLAGLAWVLGQIHVAYAVYGLLLLGPWFGLWALLGWVRSWARPARLSAWLALACLATFAPFALLSLYGPSDTRPLPYATLESAPRQAAAPAPAAAPKPRPGVAPLAGPHPNHADDALGGHLETALEPLSDGRLVFMPERIGGWAFVAVGFVGSVLAIALYRRRRLPLIAALLAALWIACLLFYSPLTTRAAVLLKGAFVVARLSTVLCSLLMAAVSALVAWPLTRLGRAGPWAYAALSLLLTLIAAALPAHAPESFVAHAKRALAPEAERRASLAKLSTRRDLLRQHLPAGSSVLSTAYFARQLVMLRDCYVVAADRGHTQIEGIEQRRRDLEIMNNAQTPWPMRERLLKFYELRFVVFENRFKKRYAWAYQHGRLLGRAAGLDVVQLELP